jgi:hypothetical protein
MSVVLVNWKLNWTCNCRNIHADTSGACKRSQWWIFSFTSIIQPDISNCCFDFGYICLNRDDTEKKDDTIIIEKIRDGSVQLEKTQHYIRQHDHKPA